MEAHCAFIDHYNNPTDLAKAVALRVGEAAVRGGKSPHTERHAQIAFLREIVGNPFGSSIFDYTWRTWNDSTVPKIAQTIYDDRRFDRLRTIIINRIVVEGTENQQRRLGPFVVRLYDADAGVP